MAETDPVRIIVEVVDQFSDDLAELRGQLEELDFKNIDVDLDVEDDGDIESIKAQLKALQKRLEAEFNIDTDGFAEAMAKKQALRGDMESSLNVNTDDILTDNQIGAIRRSTKRTLRDVAPRADPYLTDEHLSGLGPTGQGFDLVRTPSPDDELVPEQFDAIDAETRRSIRDAATSWVSDEAFEGIGADFDFGETFPGPGNAPPGFDVDMPDMDARRNDKMSFGRQMKRAAENADNLGKTLLQYRPSIMDWWNIMALLIPVMLTLVGAVIGLTAALVALGAAAATIAGVGLLGWGDSLSESFKEVQQEAKRLGKTLFDVLQPAANAFQPLQEDAMEAAPALLADLVAPMQDLVVFSDTLGSIGTGFVEWMEEGMRAAIALNEEIGQILLRFGGAIGNMLIETLQTMVKDVYQNQEAYAALGGMFMDLVIIIFNFVKAVAFATTQMKWLLDVVTALSSLLSNKWAVTLIVAIGLIVALEVALQQVLFAMAAVQSAGIIMWLKSTFPMLTAAISLTKAWAASIWEAYGAWATLAAATGVGLLALGGSLLVHEGVKGMMSGPSNTAQGASGGGNTFIEVQGDVEKKQMDRLLDKVPGETQNEMTMQNGMR